MGPFVDDRPQAGGVDPLDARVADAGAAAAASARSWRLHTRLALGLSPSATPGLLLLLAGVALGPHGLGLLSPQILSSLDPAMPVALAALGVLIGLGFNLRASGQGRVLAAASVESALTIAVVAGGALVLAPFWNLPAEVPPWFLAAALGICAACSSTVVSAGSSDSGGLVGRIGDLDDLLPIAVGGLALALLRETTVSAALMLALQAGAVALVIAAAGWLLLARSSSDTEQRVFVIALLLLLGGAAEYLSLSALVSGVVAGLFWEAIGGPARDAVRRDALHIQHPLLVIVLIVTGAHVNLPAGWLGMGLAYLFLRTASKLAGGWLARRIAGPDETTDVGLALLSPGIVGIAFALNAVRATSADAAPILAIVVFGAIGSEVMAMFVRLREDTT